MSYEMVRRPDLFADPALARLDQELAGYARDASPELPATFVDRVMASVVEERVARAPFAFVKSLAAGSLTGVVRSFREVAHAAFGHRVPVLVRVQAMVLMALVSLFLGAAVALAALGAVELLRVAQLPPAQPQLMPSPSASASIPGQPGIYPGATLTPLSTPAPRAPGPGGQPPPQTTTPSGAVPRETAQPRSTPRAGATRTPAPRATGRPRATATRKPTLPPLPLPTVTPRVTLPPLPLPSLPLPSILP